MATTEVDRIPALRDRLSIKASRSCRGREGIAWSATLCVDGKPAAQISDDGNGGMLHWDWIGGRGFFSGEERDGGPSPALTPAGQVWHDYVAALPADDCGAVTDATAIARLVDEDESARKCARIDKKEVRFRLAGDASDCFRTIGRPDKAALTEQDRISIRLYLAQKYGQRLVKVYAVGESS